MSIFRKKERDLGVCAAVMCPHCQSLSQFMLCEVSAALAFYSVRLFEVDRCYQLVCGSCKFRKDMECKELQAAIEAMQLFSKLECGAVTPGGYLQALDVIEFPSLHALREEAKALMCPQCGERVPAQLGGCWKCNSVRPGFETASPTESEVPKLPAAITRSSNPWE